MTEPNGKTPERPPRSWYVYALTDPRDGSVFYVGKGTGKRAASHERKVAGGGACYGRKDSRIASILVSGGRVEIRILAVFDDERLAYAFEKATISTLRYRLLNALGGGQGALSISHHMRARLRAVALLSSVLPVETWERLGHRSDEDRKLRQYVIDSLREVAA